MGAYEDLLVYHVEVFISTSSKDRPSPPLEYPVSDDIVSVWIIGG